MTVRTRSLVASLVASLAAAAILAGGAGAAAAKNDRPADQAVRDAALLKMRAALIVAVKRRDTAAVLGHFTPKVMLSFGGDAGRARLRQLLASDRGLWANLEWVLENGGYFNRDGSFTAPWTFHASAKGIEGVEAGVLSATRVNIRSAPRSDAPVLATLSFGVLKIIYEQNGPKAWRKVQLPGNKVGFVHRRFIRSVIDYRATFTRVNGRWMISSFVAGD